jgi:hypothetical protein
MKGNCAGSGESRFSTGLCFSFLWGLEIGKLIFNNSDFGWVKI